MPMLPLPHWAMQAWAVEPGVLMQLNQHTHLGTLARQACTAPQQPPTRQVAHSL
jgi:hypothetical protein